MELRSSTIPGRSREEALSSCSNCLQRLPEDHDLCTTNVEFDCPKADGMVTMTLEEALDYVFVYKKYQTSESTWADLTFCPTCGYLFKSLIGFYSSFLTQSKVESPVYEFLTGETSEGEVEYEEIDPKADEASLSGDSGTSGRNEEEFPPKKTKRKARVKKAKMPAQDESSNNVGCCPEYVFVESGETEVGLPESVSVNQEYAGQYYQECDENGVPVTADCEYIKIEYCPEAEGEYTEDPAASFDEEGNCLAQFAVTEYSADFVNGDADPSIVKTEEEVPEETGGASGNAENEEVEFNDTQTAPVPDNQPAWNPTQVHDRPGPKSRKKRKLSSEHRRDTSGSNGSGAAEQVEVTQSEPTIEATTSPRNRIRK